MFVFNNQLDKCLIIFTLAYQLSVRIIVLQVTTQLHT